jgi:hypothetical protein
MALLLSLPFPGIPPFTSSLPCYDVILIAASMMEEDGVLIWFGYAMAAATALKAVAVAVWQWIVGVFS